MKGFAGQATPPNLSGEQLSHSQPMTGKVWIETFANGGLRRETGTTLELPGKSERQQRAENRGIVFAVGDEVETVKPGDEVQFHIFGSTWVTSGDRRFTVVDAQAIYARIEP